ncbi:hypothetical protein ABET36_15050, partial [Caldifermentibacillus hisashii]|uniref:hypothetical protein n=1 Tax=Caldifermentibacillus hisashii TaxID=996558 RepID=UPI003D1B19DF
MQSTAIYGAKRKKIADQKNSNQEKIVKGRKKVSISLCTILFGMVMETFCAIDYDCFIDNISGVTFQSVILQFVNIYELGVFCNR